MTRWAQTRGARWGARTAAADAQEAERRRLLQRNPRLIVENILSRKSVRDQVARRLLKDPEAGQDAAVDAVAEFIGVPREIVLECLTIEALETGQ